MSRPLNPVLWLELRLRFRFRSRKFWVVSGLFVLLFALFSWAAQKMTELQNDPRATATALLAADSFLLLALMMLAGAVAGAGRISQEREQRTLAGLLNTPLSAERIVWGKLLGTWAFSAWFLLLSLPFFLGAVALSPGIAGAAAANLAVCLLASMTAGALGLGFSGYFRRSLASNLATGLFILLWLLGVPLLGAIWVGSHMVGHRGGPIPLAAQAAFFFHNPFGIVGYVVHGLDPRHGPDPFLDSAWPWLVAVGAWAALAALAFAGAVGSLRRGLFDRS